MNAYNYTNNALHEGLCLHLSHYFLTAKCAMSPPACMWTKYIKLQGTSYCYCECEYRDWHEWERRECQSCFSSIFCMVWYWSSWWWPSLHSFFKVIFHPGPPQSIRTTVMPAWVRWVHVVIFNALLHVAAWAINEPHLPGYKHRPRCAKSPTVQDTFWPLLMAGLISLCMKAIYMWHSPNQSAHFVSSLL